MSIAPGFAALAAFMSFTVPLQAQAEGALELEEVIVTARKRDESLSTAPVAITALNEKQLRQYNIRRIEDMASLAGGGVIIAKNAVSPTISIRGVSSDSTNSGFDQSVGIIIDGVFYDRSRWIDQGYFDVSQVEILKGPQALYFGKSTVAGAVVLTTGNPTEEFEGSVTVGHEFEADEWYTQGYISGPITDNLGGRLAFLYSDSDGWLTNQAPVPGYQGKDYGGLKETMTRLTLEWDPNEEINVNFKALYGTQKDDGPASRAQIFDCRGPSPFGTTITNIPGDLQGVYGAPYPIADDCKLNDKISVYSGHPGTAFDKQPEGEYDSWATSLSVNWEFDSWTLTSVTGLNEYEVNQNTGYIQAQGIIAAWGEEKNESFSQEFRLLSNYDGPLNYLLGINYQDNELYAANASQIILGIPDTRNGRTASQEHDVRQDTITKSVFAEVTWDITDQFTMSAGARYTEVEKDAEFDVYFINEWFDILFGGFWLPEGTFLETKITETDFSPQLTLEYQASENLKLFASYKEGFLPGGFSTGATPQAGLTLNEFLFDSEDVDGFEIGAKATLLDGRLSMDLIAYDYEYTNLQVNVYVPTTASFIVGNADQASTQGLEGSFRWQYNENLLLRGHATYNKGEYGQYLNQCFTLQTAAQGCNAATGSQNVKGEALPRAPEYTYGLGGNYSKPIGALVLSLAADISWSDEYNTETTANPALVQDSFSRVDAAISLSDANETWKLALLGRNLTNEMIASFGATRGFTNDNLMELLPPRLYSLEFTYNF